MTLICVKGGEMAADSMSIQGGMTDTMPFPKIWRGPHGLLGMTGFVRDIWFVGNWWEKGAKEHMKPQAIDKSGGDDSIECLVLRLDGSVWMMDHHLEQWPTEYPAAIGASAGRHFARGLMVAGKSAGEAVLIAIDHCSYIGGRVQVERLAEKPNAI